MAPVVATDDLAAPTAYLASMTDTRRRPRTLDDIPREPTQDGPAVRLYLVDGSGFIFRAYHALPPLTRKSDGLPVGAVAGLLQHAVEAAGAT